MPASPAKKLLFSRKYRTVDITLRTRIVTNEGINLNDFFKHQQYVIEPTTPEGCVIEAELTGVHPVGRPASNKPVLEYAGRPAFTVPKKRGWVKGRPRK